MSESARQISLGYQPHLPARRMLNFRSIGSAIPSNPDAGTTDTCTGAAQINGSISRWIERGTDRQPV